MINEQIVFNEKAGCFELSATDIVPENLVRAVEVALTILSTKFGVSKSDVLDTIWKEEKIVDCRTILVSFICERTSQYGYNSEHFVYRFFSIESKRLIKSCIDKFERWRHQSLVNSKKLYDFKALVAEVSRFVPFIFGQTQGNNTPVVTKPAKIVFLEVHAPVIGGVHKYNSEFSHDEYFEILVICAINTFPELTREMIISKSREGNTTLARKLIMRGMRKFFKGKKDEASFAKIGSYFEGGTVGAYKDHSTVMNAMKTLNRLEEAKETKFMRHLAGIMSTISIGDNLVVPAVIPTTRAMDIVKENLNGEADLAGPEIISRSNIHTLELLEIIQRFYAGFEVEKLNI